MTAERQARIRDAAYRIWEEEGRPEGRDLDHWLKAEALVPEAAPARKPRAPRAKAVEAPEPAKAPKAGKPDKAPKAAKPAKAPAAAVAKTRQPKAAAAKA